jgi:hypothetical protein
MTWTEFFGSEIGLAAIVIALVLGCAVLVAAWPFDRRPPP